MAKVNSFASDYQNTQTDLSSIEKAEFEKGLALDNNNPFCQLNYAASLYVNGDYQDAWTHLVANSLLPNSRYDNQLTLNIYNKVQTLNSADEYSLIETTYQRLGQTDNAFAILQKGVALYPNNVPLMCDLGGVYINKWYAAEQANPNVSNDLLKQAEMYLQKGIQLNPQSASCHGNYALAIYNDNSQSLSLVWPEVEKAESLGWVFDQKFLTNLQAVSPEPKQ